MKKFTFMGLALSFCAANGYAQQTIGSFADLQAAKDSVAKISTYQADLQETKTLYNSLLSGAMNIKPTERKDTTVYFLKGLAERSAISTYYDDVFGGNKTSNAKLRISRTTVLGPFGGQTKLTVYAPDQVVDKSVEVVELSVNENWGSSSTIISGNNQVSSIIFYVKDENGDYETAMYAVTDENVVKDQLVLGILLNASKSAIALERVPQHKDIYVRNDAYLNAQSQLAANETRQNYINAALNGGTWQIKTVAWNEAGTDVDVVENVSSFSFPGVVNYKSLKLASDITIDNANFTMGNMAEDYSFDGAGKTVTGKGNTLFGTNNGEISNVKLSGCNLVTTNSGTISNVEVKGGVITTVVNRGTIKSSLDNASGSLYNVYDSKGNTADIDGNVVGDYGNIYNNASLRKEFGVNVATGEVSMGSKYKLYEVNAYSDAKKTGERRIVNIGANGEITTHSSNAWTVGTGAFYYITDTDAADILANLDAADAVENVVYTIDGSDWNCKKAVVSNSADANIYIHKGFNAETVSYDRTFNVAAGNASTICLPFAVSEANLANVIGEGGKLLQFNKVEENGDKRTYWFKYVSNGMEANQPYILQFGNTVNGKVFNLNNVEFIATGSANTAALEQSDPGVDATLCGTFKKQTASELEGGRYSIYGFQNGEFVRMTGETRFLPTRAYVKREGFIPAESSAKSYKLGILDENDNDVTAISSVEKAADKFSVKGGNGVITVNADKEQAIKVYTAGGALVKSEVVAAGETSISVAAGLYIVNGNKVVVK